jgi:hypothetical protein
MNEWASRAKRETISNVLQTLPTSWIDLFYSSQTETAAFVSFFHGGDLFAFCSLFKCLRDKCKYLMEKLMEVSVLKFLSPSLSLYFSLFLSHPLKQLLLIIIVCRRAHINLNLELDCDALIVKRFFFSRNDRTTSHSVWEIEMGQDYQLNP